MDSYTCLCFYFEERITEINETKIIFSATSLNVHVVCIEFITH